jgi:N-acyl-D-amino-acid deacylase
MRKLSVVTRLLLAGLAAVLFVCLPLAGQTQDRDFDVIIAGGRVVDGTGASWFRADVGIAGDRIAAVGDLRQAKAGKRIDASNLVVAPGFIDLLGQSEFNLLVDNRAASKILQGVTTEVSGEGTTLAPINDHMVEDLRPNLEHYKVTVDWRTLGEYFDRLENKIHPAINMALFVGVGGVRDYVMGKDSRRPTREELNQMKQLLAQSMEEGALGVSSSLQYVPDRFFTTDELVELASVANQYGGVYFTHQRSEGNQIFPSLDEVFAIAEKARAPAEIWHLKVAYKANWDKMPEVLSRIEHARARGLDVTANTYPYSRASNSLHSCLPLWVREGGVEKMVARLQDLSLRERIKREMDDPNVTEWENQWYGSGGADGVMVSSVLHPELRKYEGMTLAEIGRAMGKDPRDALMDLVIADRGETSCVISIMKEEDVRTCLKHPFVSICTDSGAKAEDGPLSESKSHPRAWGTFPRILGKYVRDEKLMPLEEAIRKMTSQPATRVGLEDRGIIRPGMAADITVFDPATIRDVATFQDPNHYSVGVHYVLVNGKVVVDQGKITPERPGRALRGPAYRKGSR